MNLFEALKLIPTQSAEDAAIPASLFGAFRRKSISFFNGLTDEKTIVYWFQSKTFTIDLRLKNQRDTPLTERQGWIGETLWEPEAELLSWQVAKNGNFQNHIQWPEPAKLHMVGNCILEFSPNNTYVEDWRQQADSGIYLGLRIQSAQHLATGKQIALDGGLIICGQYMAYAQSRLPELQNQLSEYSSLDEAVQLSADTTATVKAIENFEVSISLANQKINYSTQSFKTGQQMLLDDFEVLDAQTLSQQKMINGELYTVLFKVDTYAPHYEFQRSTTASSACENWYAAEQNHLAFHAAAVK